MEHMPNVVRADSYGYPRTVWIDNLTSNRHYDTLDWEDPADMNEPGATVVLNEARIRDLHAKLGAIIAEFDGKGK